MIHTVTAFMLRHFLQVLCNFIQASKSYNVV
jgi:hypothetical protein